jgi:hypothetical protein
VKALLQMLKTSRTARRDAVLGRLNSAQARLASARAEQERALDEARAAHIARKDWVLGKGAASDRAWRLAMMPSVEAQFEQRSATYYAAEAAAQVCMDAVQVQRDELNVCERALMRNDEWAVHMKAEEQLAQRLDEQNQDDDLAVQSRSTGWNLKIESGSCV